MSEHPVPTPSFNKDLDDLSFENEASKRRRKAVMLVSGTVAVVAAVLGVAFLNISETESSAESAANTIFSLCDNYNSTSGPGFFHEGIECEQCEVRLGLVVLQQCNHSCTSWAVNVTTTETDALEASCDLDLTIEPLDYDGVCPAGYYKTVEKTGCNLTNTADVITFFDSCFFCGETNVTIEECFEACESEPDCVAVITNPLDPDKCSAITSDASEICNTVQEDTVRCDKIDSAITCFDEEVTFETAESRCAAEDKFLATVESEIKLQRLANACPTDSCYVDSPDANLDVCLFVELPIFDTEQVSQCDMPRGYCCAETTDSPTNSPTAAPTETQYIVIPQETDDISEYQIACSTIPGARTASILSQADQDLAWSVCEAALIENVNPCGCWLGVDFLPQIPGHSKSNFVWEDGSGPLSDTYDNFETYPEVQPNNLDDRDERCVHMRPFTNGGWNDIPCTGICDADDSRPFPLCELGSPTAFPTTNPTESPTGNPTVSPTPKPTGFPSDVPTTSPTNNPTRSPTTSPTKAPTTSPTKAPTRSPTISPTDSPTKSPTTSPTKAPTKSPTISPTRSPTTSPTRSPTKSPTRGPTVSPTKSPTTSPTESPTKSPTRSPTKSPTLSPTASPTKSPTTSPTASPTEAPTVSPTESPTDFPTISPTPKPTKSPSNVPTVSPTDNPTKSPTTSPTDGPTTSPTVSPTLSPSISPTVSPTKSPTTSPTESPTKSPSTSPTLSPTNNPTTSPTNEPTRSPTLSPAKDPTDAPTRSPTESPTPKPTVSPTPFPTKKPIVDPICKYKNGENQWEVRNKHFKNKIKFLFWFKKTIAWYFVYDEDCYDHCSWHCYHCVRVLYVDDGDSETFVAPSDEVYYYIKGKGSDCDDDKRILTSGSSYYCYLGDGIAETPEEKCKCEDYVVEKETFDSYPLGIQYDNSDFHDHWHQFSNTKVRIRNSGSFGGNIPDICSTPSGKCLEFYGKFISKKFYYEYEKQKKYIDTYCTVSFKAAGHRKCGKNRFDSEQDALAAGCHKYFPHDNTNRDNTLNVRIYDEDGHVLAHKEIEDIPFLQGYEMYSVTADVIDKDKRAKVKFQSQGQFIDHVVVGNYIDEVEVTCCCIEKFDIYIYKLVYSLQGDTGNNEPVPADRSDPTSILNKPPSYNYIQKNYDDKDDNDVDPQVYSFGIGGQAIYRFDSGFYDKLYIFEETILDCKKKKKSDDWECKLSDEDEDEDASIEVSVDGINFVTIESTLKNNYWYVFDDDDDHDYYDDDRRLGTDEYGAPIHNDNTNDDEIATDGVVTGTAEDDIEYFHSYSSYQSARRGSGNTKEKQIKKIRYYKIHLPHNDICYKYVRITDKSVGQTDADDGFDLHAIKAKKVCCNANDNDELYEGTGDAAVTTQLLSEDRPYAGGSIPMFIVAAAAASVFVLAVMGERRRKTKRRRSTMMRLTEKAEEKKYLAEDGEVSIGLKSDI